MSTKLLSQPRRTKTVGVAAMRMNGDTQSSDMNKTTDKNKDGDPKNTQLNERTGEKIGAKTEDKRVSLNKSKKVNVILLFNISSLKSYVETLVILDSFEINAPPLTIYKSRDPGVCMRIWPKENLE